MAFDTKKWLTEEMGFTAEEAETLAPTFASRADRLEAGFLGKSGREKFLADQSELERMRADFTAKNESLTREMAEWATLSEREKQTTRENQEALEAARVRIAQIETRLASSASQYGFDPKTILDGTAVVPPKKEEPVAPIDTTKFVGRDQLVPVLDFQLELPGTLQYIAEQHRDLFGQSLDTREITKEIKARAAKNDPNIDPIRIWEEKYGVGAKREANAKAKYDADIAAAEARGRDAALSERAAPGPQDPGRHAPIFRNGEGRFAPRTSRLQRPQPESGVRSAAAALATGKYRVADTGARG